MEAVELLQSGPRGITEADLINQLAKVWESRISKTPQRYIISSNEVSAMCVSAIRVGKKLNECELLIEKLRKELSRDADRLERKVGSGQEWLRNECRIAADRVSLLYEMTIHIRDVDHYPESIVKAEGIAIQLWNDIHSELQRQFNRFKKQGTCAAELSMKYNRIEYELTSIRELLSTVKEYMKIGGPEDVKG